MDGISYIFLPQRHSMQSAPLIILSILFLLVSCTSGEKVGVILPLSGEAAEFGEDVLEGIALAQEEHPSIDIVVQDGKFEPRENLLAYHRLRGVSDVRVIIGPFGPIGASTIQGAMSEKERKEVLIVGVTVCTEDFRSYENVLCTYPSLREQIESALSFAQRNGRMQGYVITDKSAMGDLVVRYVEEIAPTLGQEILEIQTIDPSQGTALYPEATKVGAKNPDFVYLVSGDLDAKFSLVKMLKEQGTDAMIIASFDLEESQIREHGNLLEGVYFPGFITDNYGAEFLEKFEERHERNPNIYHALGYDLAKTVFLAIEQGTLDREGVLSIMNENDFAIIGYRHENGSAIAPIETKLVQNSKLVVADS